MGRPSKLGESVQVAFRLPLDLVARLDAYAQTLAAPGLFVSRADAARVLMLKGLDAAGAPTPRAARTGTGARKTRTR